MNVHTITTKVAEFAPDAKDVHCVDAGRGVWACIATVNGKSRAVQFDAAGLYGQAQPGMYASWPKSELWIAAQIAQELRK